MVLNFDCAALVAVSQLRNADVSTAFRHREALMLFMN